MRRIFKVPAAILAYPVVLPLCFLAFVVFGLIYSLLLELLILFLIAAIAGNVIRWLILVPILLCEWCGMRVESARKAENFADWLLLISTAAVFAYGVAFKIREIKNFIDP